MDRAFGQLTVVHLKREREREGERETEGERERGRERERKRERERGRWTAPSGSWTVTCIRRALALGRPHGTTGQC